MHLAVERGVPQEERKTVTAGFPDWDAARIFLEVVRCGSFGSAAERLGLSINAVRRRIDNFERQTGATLFTRDVHGARLTEEGALMVSAAERMEAASLRSADVSRHEADVAIHLSRPATLDVKLVRLGRMHMMFFASPKYLETHGTPRSLDEVRQHRLVLQIADEAAAKEAFESVLPGYAQRDLVVMKTNVSSAKYWAIGNGAGIGVFPTCALALGGKMIPLDVGLRWWFDIWLSYHLTSGRISRVRRMIDWLIEAFNPAKYPWFRDEFTTSTGT